MSTISLDRTLTWTAIITAAKEGCAVLMLGNGDFTLVDEDFLEDVEQCKWYRHTGGYVYRGGGGEYLHRRIMGAPAGVQVDHRNKNKNDNRRFNLRPCTQSQNNANSLLRPHTNSQFKGVRLRPSGRYEAYGIGQYLGMFDTAIEAARAYDRWAFARWGEFAHLNFPDLLMRGEFKP